MKLRDARVIIEKTRKEYTKQFDEAKKDAINLANELFDVITPIEEDLKAKEEVIDREKEEIRQQKEREAMAIINQKISVLAKYGYIADIYEIQNMSDADFNTLVEEQKLVFEEYENARIEKEESDRKEREEFERQKSEMEAKQKEMDEREAKLKEAEDKAKEAERSKAREKELEEARK